MTARHLRELGAQAGIVVAAWGAHKAATTLAIESARVALRTSLSCLGVTKDGAPRHPCRLAAETPLVPFGAAL